MKNGRSFDVSCLAFGILLSLACRCQADTDGERKDLADLAGYAKTVTDALAEFRAQVHGRGQGSTIVLDSAKKGRKKVDTAGVANKNARDLVTALKIKAGITVDGLAKAAASVVTIQYNTDVLRAAVASECHSAADYGGAAAQMAIDSISGMSDPAAVAAARETAKECARQAREASRLATVILYDIEADPGASSISVEGVRKEAKDAAGASEGARKAAGLEDETDGYERLGRYINETMYQRNNSVNAAAIAQRDGSSNEARMVAASVAERAAEEATTSSQEAQDFALTLLNDAQYDGEDISKMVALINITEAEALLAASTALESVSQAAKKTAIDAAVTVTSDAKPGDLYAAAIKALPAAKVAIDAYDRSAQLETRLRSGIAAFERATMSSGRIAECAVSASKAAQVTAQKASEAFLTTAEAAADEAKAATILGAAQGAIERTGKYADKVASLAKLASKLDKAMGPANYRTARTPTMNGTFIDAGSDASKGAKATAVVGLKAEDARRRANQALDKFQTGAATTARPAATTDSAAKASNDISVVCSQPSYIGLCLLGVALIRLSSILNKLYHAN